MLSHYKYTDKQKDELLKSIIIIIDTNEQVYEHVTDYFNKNKIPYIRRKLPYGDYSFYIPKNEELSIPRDIYFDKEITIERKRNLDEISGNLSEKARFEKEICTYTGKMYLLIENNNYTDIPEKNYKTDIKPKSFLALLHSMSIKYDLPFIFIPDNSFSGLYIYCVLYYYLRSKLH